MQQLLDKVCYYYGSFLDLITVLSEIMNYYQNKFLKVADHITLSYTSCKRSRPLPYFLSRLEGCPDAGRLYSISAPPDHPLKEVRLYSGLSEALRTSIFPYFFPPSESKNKGNNQDLIHQSHTPPSNQKGKKHIPRFTNPHARHAQ